MRVISHTNDDIFTKKWSSIMMEEFGRVRYLSKEFTSVKVASDIVDMAICKSVREDAIVNVQSVMDSLEEGLKADRDILSQVANIFLDTLDSALNNWDDPIAICSELLPVMEFDADLLPEPLKDYVIDSAEQMQAPIDFIACCLMGYLGGVVGRSCRVKPKEYSDWEVVPNLWCMLVGRPAMMKSPAMKSANVGLAHLIKQAKEEFNSACSDYELDEMVYSAQKKDMKDKINKAVRGGNKTKDIEKPIKPQEPIEERFLTSASSVERLIALLAENPKGIIQNRDELLGLLRTLEQSNGQDGRAFFLEAWNGNSGAFSYDTNLHGHLSVNSPCVSVIGGIQPSPLSSLVYQATKGAGGDDGFIQRFQLAVYPDRATTWKYIDKPVNIDLKQSVVDVFSKIVSMEGVCRFSDDAQEIFVSWYSEIMQRVRSEESTVMEGHLGKYPDLMLSIALLIHLAEYTARPHFTNQVEIPPISTSAAEKAIKWCCYLESHARRIYDLGNNAGFTVANSLLKKLNDGAFCGSFTAREIHRKNWSGLTDKNDVKNALEVLEVHNWVKSETKPMGKNGGRPLTVFHLHPNAKEFMK